MCIHVPLAKVSNMAKTNINGKYNVYRNSGQGWEEIRIAVCEKYFVIVQTSTELPQSSIPTSSSTSGFQFFCALTNTCYCPPFYPYGFGHPHSPRLKAKSEKLFLGASCDQSVFRLDIRYMPGIWNINIIIKASK